jgi:hypothetical protein
VLPAVVPVGLEVEQAAERIKAGRDEHRGLLSYDTFIAA